MLRKLLACSVLSFLSFGAHGAPADDLNALFDEAWEWRLSENPVFASRLGDRRYNDQWTDSSLEAIERRHETRQDFLRRLQAIDPGQLADTDRLNYDLFRRSLQNDIDGHRFRDYLMPINQRGGVQSLESTAEGIRLQTAEDYQDWLARMARVEEVIEQTMALQEAGREGGYMPPKILMERIPAQIDAQLVEDGTQSPFYKAFVELPATIDADQQRELRERATTIIEESIVPRVSAFRSVLQRNLPAGEPRNDRRVAAAQWRSVLRAPGGNLHNHAHDAGRNPSPGTRRSRKNPRGNAAHHR